MNHNFLCNKYDNLNSLTHTDINNIYLNLILL